MSKIHSPDKSFFFVTQTGYLLPLLILLNLFFGWMFFKPLHWLLIEGIMVLLFILNVRIMMRKIFTPSLNLKATI
jgi:hypothetical protein